MHRIVAVALVLASTILLPGRQAAADIEPRTVTVPAHPAWCVESDAVTMSDAQGNDAAIQAFETLYRRLVTVASQSGMTAIGVPSAESVRPAPATDAAGTTDATGTADPGSAPPPPKFIVRVCAIVPSDAPDAPAGIAKVEVPKRKAYAMLCRRASEPDCEQAIKDKMKADLKLSDDAVEALKWVSGAAIADTDDDDTLIKSLADHSLQHTDTTEAAAPADTMVVAALIP